MRPRFACVYFPCVCAALRTRDVSASPLTAAAAEPARWGRRRWLLLAGFFTYSLAYLDRANFGFGAAAGMSRTLHITGNPHRLLGAMFFLGYFLFQVPGMLIGGAAVQRDTRRLRFSLVMWGVLASLTGVLHSFTLLCVDRFILGLAESVTFPAMLFLLTRWFPRRALTREQLLMLGNPVTVLWMSAITGFLDPAARLAADIHHRRPSVRLRGVSSGSGLCATARRGTLAAAFRPRVLRGDWRRATARARAAHATPQTLSRFFCARMLIVLSSVLLLEPGRVWVCALAADHRSSGLRAFHGRTGLLPPLRTVADGGVMGHVSDRTPTARCVWPLS